MLCGVLYTFVRGRYRMSRSANQKLKLLYLSKILKERTDDEHYLTMPENLMFLAEKKMKDSEI